MLPHRLPGAHHIATPQRGEQRLPVAEPLQPPGAAGNMHIELLPQRAAVHLQPDPLYRRQQHLVLRRPGEHQMEQTSVILRGVVESDCPLLLFNNPLQIVDIGAGGHFRGKGGDVALQQLARLENFKRADVAAEQLLLFAVVLVRNAHDIHPGSLTNIHRPLQLQHQQRFAHDGPADAIGFGNMAFRRQTRPDRVAPLRDLGAQVITNLLIGLLFRRNYRFFHKITCALHACESNTPLS